MTTAAPERPERICLIKPSALGDVVTAVPVLRALRRRWPKAHIAWLVRDTFAPLIADDPDLDEVIPFNRRLLGRFWRGGAGLGEVRRLRGQLRQGRFDWAIDLQGLARSGYFAKWTAAPLRIGFVDARELAWRHYTIRVPVAAEDHTIDRNAAVAAALGVAVRSDDLRLHVGDDARGRWRRAAAEAGLPPEGFFALTAATTWTTKQYPLRHWISVARRLAATAPVALLGTAADEPFCKAVAEGAGAGVVNAAGRTDLPSLVAALEAAGAVVCCDSAAKFIAAAVGTPCLTLIGPTRAHRTGPWPAAGNRAATLVADVACQGCLKKRCRHITCMQLISPDRVAMAAGELLLVGRA